MTSLFTTENDAAPWGDWTDGVNQNTGAVALETTIKYSGTGSYKHTSGTNASAETRGRKALSADEAEVWVTLRFYHAMTGNPRKAYFFCKIVTAAGGDFGVGVDTTTANKLKAYKNSGGYAEYLESGASLTPSAWHKIEFRVVVSATAGILEGWVDDVRVINQTGLNTGTSLINNIRCGLWNGDALARTVYIDLVEIGTTQSSGVTAVFDTIQAIWNDRAILSDTSQSIWNIRAAVSDTVQSIWNIGVAVSDQVQGIWKVKSLVNQTRQAIWNLRGAISQSRQTIWNTRAAISDQAQGIWNVKTTISDQVQSIWNTKALAAKTTQLIYHTRSVVSDTVQTIWNVLTPLTAVSDTIQAIWHNRAGISDTVQTVFHVRALTAKTAQAIWHDRATISDTSQSIWNVRTFTSQTRQAIWKLRAAISQTRQALWNVLSNLTVFSTENDSAPPGDWTQIITYGGGAVVLETTIKYSGTGSYKHTTGGAAYSESLADKVLPADQPELWVTFYLYLPANINNAIFAKIVTAGGGAVYIGTSDSVNNKLRVAKEIGGWQAWEESGASLQVGSWNAIKFRCVISATVGILEGWVNGIQRVTATGLNLGVYNIRSGRCGLVHMDATARTAYIDKVAFLVTDTSPPPPPPIAGWFNANSIWNRPIGANPTIHADSAAIVALISGYAKPIIGVDWPSAPIEEVTDPNEATADVYESGVVHTSAVPKASTVLITLHAKSSGGQGDFTDGKMVIHDIARNRAYAFGVFNNLGSPITCVAGGWLGLGTDADGIKTWKDGGYGWGGRATGWSTLAGLITRADIIAGVISHALALVFQVNDVRQTLYVWPAMDTDGSSATSPMKMGMRLQLNPSVDVESLSMSAGGKAICRALQTYGGWLSDSTTAGEGAQFQVQGFFTGTYPNVQSDPAPWSGLLTQNDLANLPLNQMRVLVVTQADFYQNANPPAAGTAVSDLIQAIWKVRQAVPKTRQLIYHVRALVADTVQAVWHDRVTASDTVQALWKVRQAVSQTRQAIWNIRAILSDTVQAIWHDRAAISDTVQAVFHVKALIAKSFQSTWNIRSLANRTRQVLWNIRSIISQARQAIWNVAGPQISPPFSLTANRQEKVVIITGFTGGLWEVETMQVFQQGETVSHSVTVKNASGQKFDPDTSIRISVTDSAGTAVITDVDMIKDAVGEYHYDYDLPANAVLGVWRVTETVVHSGRTTIVREFFRVE